jgi:hypothetical protein
LLVLKAMHAVAGAMSAASTAAAPGRKQLRRRLIAPASFVALLVAVSLAASGLLDSGRLLHLATSTAGEVRHLPPSGRLGGGEAAGDEQGGRIPRIIHQNYLGGAEALASAALQPKSHFRKEWWRSCQVGLVCQSRLRRWLQR